MQTWGKREIRLESDRIFGKESAELEKSLDIKKGID